MFDQDTIGYTLFVFALVSILLPMIGNRTGTPFLLLIGRWMRWLLFAALFVFFLNRFELSYRPQWVLFITGAVIWFLLETGYNWIAIKALSHSELPLFPVFSNNNDGDEWPADKRFINLRDWLRKEGFVRLTALKAELFEGTYLRASIYESADKFTRLQILFLPKRKDGSSACYTLSTAGKNERRLITDNLFLPYGGYYPEGWNLARKPLIGSLKRLMALHRRRLIQSSIEPVAFDDEPLEELNDQQRILERLNLETGFLVPRSEREEIGKISYDGRYRLWKEMWLLAYFGRSVA